jgi:hypothetical protein
MKAVLERHSADSILPAYPSQAFNFAHFITQSARATYWKEAMATSSSIIEVAIVALWPHAPYEQDQEQFRNACRGRKKQVWKYFARELVRGAMQSHNPGQRIHVCSKGISTSRELAPDDVPMVWTDGVLEPSMSKEEWVGEWLCS